MKRILTLLLLAAMIAAGPAPRVLVIRGPASPAVDEHLAGFASRLKLKPEVRVLTGDTAALARELRTRPPALVLAVGTAAADLAVQSQTTAPILFTMVYTPEGRGLAGRAGVAGLSLRVPPAETMKALTTLMPGKKLRVGAIYQTASARAEADSVRAVLAAAGHSFTGIEVASQAEAGTAFNDLFGKIDVLWLLADPSVIPDADYLRFILKKALDRRVAVVGLSDSHVRLGALLSVSVDYRLEGAAAADLADRIIAGTRPEAIGIVPPRNLVWSLNTAVARELGIPLPDMIRHRFERVYP